jgi:hypothetical protein
LRFYNASYFNYRKKLFTFLTQFPSEVFGIGTVFFFMAQQPTMGQGLIIVEASRSHSDPRHTVGLFWTSDQPDAQTSTSQHNSTHMQHASTPLSGIRTRHPSMKATADPSFRPCGHWDRQLGQYKTKLILPAKYLHANAVTHFSVVH